MFAGQVYPALKASTRPILQQTVGDCLAGRGGAVLVLVSGCRVARHFREQQLALFRVQILEASIRLLAPVRCARVEILKNDGIRVCWLAPVFSVSHLNACPMASRCSCSLSLTAMPEFAFKVKKLYESITKRVTGNAGKHMTGNDCTAMVLSVVCESDHASGHTPLKTGACADTRGVRRINRQ